MIFLKTLLSHLRISHSLQRSFFSESSSSAPKPTTLSSLFAKKPPKASQIPLTKEPFLVPKPSAKEKSSLSSFFSTGKPSTNRKLPNKVSSSTSSDLLNIEKPSTNGKLPKKHKRVGVPVMEEKEFLKELSAEATKLISRLIADGYLKDANYVRGEQLESQQIPANSYSLSFLRRAAEMFGKEHQEVAKWLSGSELKKVALFGCPSVEKNSVFAAKRLRAFFRIQEEVVCRDCKLRTSCKFTNKKVGTMDKVVLEDVMRLVTVYTFDSIPSQLVVPNELKCSVSKLVEEAISLTN